jgi:hypothetical protein
VELWFVVVGLVGLLLGFLVGYVWLRKGILVFLPLFSLLMVILPLLFQLCEFALAFPK